LVTVTLVQATTPPLPATISITAPPALTVEATGALTAVALGTATATDLVDGNLIPISNAPAAFPLGATTVIYTATNSAGNTVTATQLVTVVDSTAPVIAVPADASGTSVGNQAVAVAIGQATATDAFAVIIGNDAPALFPIIGTTLVTWTATDANGNSSTAVQRIIVTSTTAAYTFLAPPDVNIETTLSGGVPFNMVPLGRPYVKTTVALTWTLSMAYYHFPVGVSQVNWKATDANGNVITAIQLVTVKLVVDTVAPVITVPVNIIVEATGVNTIVNHGVATAVDNVINAVVTISNNAPASFPLGTTIIRYTASDGSGNRSTALQNVTVIDTTPPTIVAPPSLNLVSNDGNAVFDPVTTGATEC